MILVGLPGSGKSTVGRLLAQRLGWPFRDSDTCIEEDAQNSISAIFDIFGEERFRDMEEAALADLLLHAPSVISTGGGVVLRAANRQRLISSQRPVIYLKADIGNISKRLKNDIRRPLMRNHDPATRLLELEVQRHALYQEVATHTIDGAKKSASMIAGLIIDLCGPI